MLIRRERPADVVAIRDVTTAAFARPDSPAPAEARLVDELRADGGWLPALSLVAVAHDGAIIGHVLCTRAHVGDAPVLGLGPLSVRPDHQRTGVGSALVHTVLGAADALDEPVVVLLGDHGYYHRFGFRIASGLGITPPDPEWTPHFQARPLHAYHRGLVGPFAYAAPFDRL
ncbi:N-acetyltransferase [Catellatospora sp. TT07R-123]|uniref:GNAT family N-acetyltransferase n=1 Tax=Catellatospora sp. TT07R-123 TaxID=2733863 RepID=UPI001B2D9130|nr:N-acetyltransferase [Catellatospora sp. TT07R-123]GHJ44728.1 N-acetyltransferase [Catellatospora sp. TT07R-123]